MAGGAKPMVDIQVQYLDPQGGGGGAGAVIYETGFRRFHRKWRSFSWWWTKRWIIQFHLWQWVEVVLVVTRPLEEDLGVIIHHGAGGAGITLTISGSPLAVGGGGGGWCNWWSRQVGRTGRWRHNPP